MLIQGGNICVLWKETDHVNLLCACYFESRQYDDPNFFEGRSKSIDALNSPVIRNTNDTNSILNALLCRQFVI